MLFSTVIIKINVETTSPFLLYNNNSHLIKGQKKKKEEGDMIKKNLDGSFNKIIAIY